MQTAVRGGNNASTADKDALAAEIAKIEAELERKKMESSMHSLDAKSAKPKKKKGQQQQSLGMSLQQLDAQADVPKPSYQSSVNSQMDYFGSTHNYPESVMPGNKTVDTTSEDYDEQTYYTFEEQTVKTTTMGNNTNNNGKKSLSKVTEEEKKSDAASVVSAKSSASAAEAERLQEEIRKMEQAILSQKKKPAVAAAPRQQPKPKAAPKPQLSAKELERQRLEQEIKDMETALQQQQKPTASQKTTTAKKKVVKKKAPAAAGPSAKELERQRAAVQAQQKQTQPQSPTPATNPEQETVVATNHQEEETPVKKKLSKEEETKLQMQKEIRQMEAAIAAAAAKKSKSSASGNSAPAHEIETQGAGGEASTNKTKVSKWAVPDTSATDRTEEHEPELPKSGFANPLLDDERRPNFLAAISEAAVQRDERVETGQLVKQDIVQMEAANTKDNQLSFSMAEMVSQKARAREKRLEEGGEKKMTKLKEKEEYKKEFKDICVDAANLGRLTRLEEHTIEAVAGEKTPEQQWKSNGLLAITWRSNHMSVIHEAAKLGSETKMPELVVTNGGVIEEEDLFELYGEKAESPRMAQLLELDAHAGGGQHKVDKLVLTRKEDTETEQLLVKPMQYYHSLEDVHLPKSRPPRVDPAKLKEKMSQQKKIAVETDKPMTDIGHDVAERAWERRTRLDRPGQMPKVKEKCPCPYCENPSPYQTYAYLVLEKKLKETGEWHKPPAPPEPEVCHRDLEAEQREKEEKAAALRQERAEKARLALEEKRKKEREQQQQQEDATRPKPKKVTKATPPPAPKDAGCQCVIL